MNWTSYLINIKTLIICFLLLFCKTYCQNNNSCLINFGNLDIKTFKVGTDLNDIEKSFELNKIHTDLKLDYENYILKEEILLFEEKKKIKYYFKFKDNMLLSYFFEIKADIAIYDKMVQQLSEINSFITYNGLDRKYAYFNTNCNDFSTFFKTKTLVNDLYVQAGISR